MFTHRLPHEFNNLWINYCDHVVLQSSVTNALTTKIRPVWWVVLSIDHPGLSAS